MRSSRSSRGGGEDAAVARKALIEMPGAEATAALAQSLEGAPAKARRAVVEILGERDSAAHAGVVLAAARDADECGTTPQAPSRRGSCRSSAGSVASETCQLQVPPLTSSA
ncbi:MAG: hypothetical protein ACYTKD_12550, partial [Planctomycetota bacterium]